MKILGLKVTFYLKSGAQITTIVREINIRKPENRLCEYTLTGGDHPLYIRLDDVAAITCRRVLTARFLWT